MNDTSADQRHSKLYWTLSDTWVLIMRSMRPIFTNIDQLLGLTIQPIMFMLLFRYVFGGAINTGGVSYVNFLVAGILVQTAAFGSLTTSLSVATDVRRGIIDRLKTLPIVSASVITGHVIADLVRNTLSAIVMILVALLVGFRPTANFIEWLQIAGILLLFTFAMSWVAAVLGLLARSVEAVQWMGFFIIFPLTFASAAFVPTESMPGFLRVFAENQPVTHVIESIRALMVGTPIGSHALLAIIWSIGISLVMIPLTRFLFRRHNSK